MIKTDVIDVCKSGAGKYEILNLLKARLTKHNINFNIEKFKETVLK